MEVGGFAPYVSINPPADSLSMLATKHNQFLLWLSKQLPHTSLGGPKVEELSKNLYRITVHITNDGFLPTNSDMGVKVQWARKVKVDVDVSEGQAIQSGRKMQLVDSIPGSGGDQEFSWIISGKKGTVKITAGTPMAGFDSKVIDLK